VKIGGVEVDEELSSEPVAAPSEVQTQLGADNFQEVS